MAVQDLNLEVIEVFNETHDVKTLRFKLDKPLDFQAGQFVMMYMDIPDQHGKVENIKRAYSIASSPAKKDWIDINFRVYSFGRFTPPLFNLKLGDKIKAKGPFGMFVHKEEDGKNVVFLSAGTGIAPIRGMIKLIEEKIHEEFLRLAEKNKNFRYIPTITRINESKKEWNGEKGRISIELIKKYVKDLKNNFFYICGPPEMVENSREILIFEGVSKENIKFERFH